MQGSRQESAIAVRPVAGGWLLAVAASLAVLVGPALRAEESPEAAIQTIYGATLKQVRATPDASDDLDLANKIVADARAMQDNKALHAAMMRQAIQLALESDSGADTAERCTQTLIDPDGVAPLTAWQELIDVTAATIRRHNRGKKEPMAEQYCQWELQVAGVARAQGNEAQTDKLLAGALKDAQFYNLKARVDSIRQLIAWRKIDAAQRAVIATAKMKNKEDDPKSNLATAEAILGQTGDWAEATPYLLGSKDPQWQKILVLRGQRNAQNEPPMETVLSDMANMLGPAAVPQAAPAVQEVLPDHDNPAAPMTAADALSLADMLAKQASPMKRPTPAGRYALLKEAAAVTAMVEQLDQSNLTMTQKLGLVTKIREARATADKARGELLDAFDRDCQLTWTAVPLNNLANEWIPYTDFNAWKVLESGELQSTGNTWQTRIRSKRTFGADVVMEAEFWIPEGGWVVFYMYRANTYFKLDVFTDFAKSQYVVTGLQGPPPKDLKRATLQLAANDWHTVRIMLADDTQTVWIDGQAMETSVNAMEKPPTSIGIDSQQGNVVFRRVRVRELK